MNFEEPKNTELQTDNFTLKTLKISGCYDLKHIFLEYCFKIELTTISMWNNEKLEDILKSETSTFYHET